jgi:hypothetical protein
MCTGQHATCAHLHTQHGSEKETQTRVNITSAMMSQELRLKDNIKSCSIWIKFLFLKEKDT